MIARWSKTVMLVALLLTAVARAERVSIVHGELTYEGDTYPWRNCVNNDDCFRLLAGLSKDEFVNFVGSKLSDENSGQAWFFLVGSVKAWAAYSDVEQYSEVVDQLRLKFSESALMDGTSHAKSLERVADFGQAVVGVRRVLELESDVEKVDGLVDLANQGMLVDYDEGLVVKNLFNEAYSKLPQRLIAEGEISALLNLVGLLPNIEENGKVFRHLLVQLMNEPQLFDALRAAIGPEKFDRASCSKVEGMISQVERHLKECGHGEWDEADTTDCLKNGQAPGKINRHKYMAKTINMYSELGFPQCPSLSNVYSRASNLIEIFSRGANKYKESQSHDGRGYHPDDYKVVGTYLVGESGGQIEVRAQYRCSQQTIDEGLQSHLTNFSLSAFTAFTFGLGDCHLRLIRQP